VAGWAAASAEQLAPQLSHHISTMAQLPETIHVLLVDDEQLSRFVVGNLLRKCNYAGIPLGLVSS
jgi:hypothetical protein